ncbi:innexin unc-9-like isoform X2 [Littorina saxatilis]|uniref:Innexin n=1 Tax=Littorina saxatilis TaxID=31220 RepID=A0AAN9GNK7_9CAEN
MAYASMERALVRVSSLFIRTPARDDDFVDRLHHNASLVLLLTFAGGALVLEYAGDPINCWTPATFPQDHYTQHVNGYCWTHPLRYPDSSHEIGISGTEAAQQLKKSRLVNFGTAFYRWATLIFVLQAMLFKMPSLVWSRLNRQSGASLTKLRDLLTDAQLNQEERGAKMDEAAQYFHSWLAAYRTPTPRKIFGREISKLACLVQCCGRRSGKYLSVVYLCVKSLYLLNVVCNFVLLSVFLDAEFWRYGITVLTQVLFQGDWHDPVNFPRLLICDFRLHGVVEPEGTTTNKTATDDSKIHPVQCVLTVNMILEKLFVIQWFWLVMLAILTVATLVTWAVHTVCGCAPYFFARKYMRSLTYPAKKEDDDRSGQRFLGSYLREDGMFVLRMIEANTSPMVVKELVQHLWDNFQARNAAFTLELTQEESEFNQVDSMKDQVEIVA